MSQNLDQWRATGALAAAMLSLLCGTALGADDAPRVGVVHLRAADVRTSDHADALAGKAFTAKWHVLVLDGPMDPARRTALQNAGVTLGGYLPTNAFIADFSKTTPAQVRALPFVVWAGAYDKAWKVDTELAQGANGRAFTTPGRQALAQQRLVAAYVWLFNGEPLAPFTKEFSKLAKSRVLSSEQIEGSYCVAVEMQGADVAKLSDIASVQFAEHMSEYGPRSNAITRWVVQSDIPNYTPLYDHGLTGTGQIIGIIDGGVAYTHCSFLDSVNPIGPLHRKVVAYNATYSYDFHGTHCAGTLVGDAGDTSDTRGIAWGARIVFNTWPNTDTPSHYAHYLLHYQQGAFVMSNSWGTDSTRQYETGCVGIDSFQYDHDDALLLFAITDGNYQVTNPENAKNSLAVTASGQYPNEASRCPFGSSFVGGLGPTTDGRRKPEVSAPGCNITSATGDGGCGLATYSGTSMACPAVAATATLVRQYFTDGFYPSGHANPSDSIVPSGPLLKAMMVNSAVDMTGIDGFPSPAEGWGRIKAMNVTDFGGGPNHLLIKDVRNASADALETGQSGSLDFWVSNCSLPLKVTMAYHDYPGTINTNPQQPELVNNLDLVVTSPAGDIYYGNNFNNGYSQRGGTPDALNNLEQVLIANAIPGHWNVTILAPAVNHGPQGYAVVVTGAVDQHTCQTADFNCDGDVGTDADIEAFFIALSGGPGDADFNRDGDVGTDADIEAFFRVLAGGSC